MSFLSKLKQSFAAAIGQIMVIDEWPDAQSFQEFFAHMEPQIALGQAALFELHDNHAFLPFHQFFHMQSIPLVESNLAGLVARG